jgi:hypothetical protein
MIIFIGYNIVGDGTPAALLPILTGKTEKELPEARRGHVGANTVDKFPWIWNKFKGRKEFHSKSFFFKQTST